MWRRTWNLRLGALGAVLLVVALAPLATTRATRVAPPEALGACPDVASRSRAPGGWWSNRPVIDADGTLRGWRLRLGHPDRSDRELMLPPEAAVSGPTAGLVVVADDDGRRSRIRLVSTAAGCAEAVLEDAEVVRRAVLAADEDAVYLHLVRRTDRADLGVWRLATDAAARLLRVLGPATDEPRIATLGPIWSTALGLDGEGRRLVAQSCNPLGCVARIVDLRTLRTTVVGGAGQGDLIALVGARLVTWASCHGLPCAVQAFDITTGRREILEVAAVSAAPFPGDSRFVAISIGHDDDRRTLLVDPQTGAARPDGTTPASEVQR